MYKIYNNYQKVKNKIFFITPLKKNLNYDTLKDRFVKDNKESLFDEDVVNCRRREDD